jgi:hypothetical protein
VEETTVEAQYQLPCTKFTKVFCAMQEPGEVICVSEDNQTIRVDQSWGILCVTHPSQKTITH